MILNVSGRTDVVAFYSDWFIRRYEEGYVDVRNPFKQDLVSRIYFKDVDLILFITKNPTPILNYISKIHHPVLFHITITPYQKDIEPNVVDKSKIIESTKVLSQILGRNNVVVRYDPIFISKKYNISYHFKAFERLCSLLDGYIDVIIVSFLDEYKNVIKNYEVLKYEPIKEEEYRLIGEKFSKSAKKHGMRVQTCFEEKTLVEYGFTLGECLSKDMAYSLTGKMFKKQTARKEKLCNCVQMVDIGYYNSCKHLCKYCYANYDEKAVQINYTKHIKTSSLLIGMLNSNDVIKEREN